MNRRIFVTASAALAAAGSWAVSAIADDSPKALLDGWLAAFNAADPAVYRAFVNAHMPDGAPYVDDDLSVREASGGFDLLRSEATGPQDIVGWVKDRNWDRFSKVVLTTGKADQISDFSYRGAAPPPGFAVTRQGEREALAGLRQKLRAEAAAGRFCGAVLVARGDRILFQQGYGMADFGRGAPATPATRFCIGSMGKMFTAVAVLQLVQIGRLRLSDTVLDHLPDYPNAMLAKQVTIEQLLTHTGGTGDIFGPLYDGHAAALKSPADLIKLYGTREPSFAPGSRFGYSNYGYILLGAIVERASGQSYDAYFQAHIFDAAGMKSTSQSAIAPGATAIAYSGTIPTGLKALAPYVGMPAGGGYSTVGDLHAFATALRSHRLLDAEHTELLITPRIDAGSARQAMGLSVRRRNGAICYGHGGTAPGVNGDLAIFPASGYETIVLSNRGYPWADNVAEYIGFRLPAPA